MATANHGVTNHCLHSERFRSAVARVAFNDVLQREPTSAEMTHAAAMDVSSSQKVLGYYQRLLCGSEFIGSHALVLSPLLLARLLINQLAGRAPRSCDEISAIAKRLFEAGWVGVIRDMLAQPEVQQRILTDINRAAQHGDPLFPATVASNPQPRPQAKTVAPAAVVPAAVVPAAVVPASRAKAAEAAPRRARVRA